MTRWMCPIRGVTTLLLELQRVRNFEAAAADAERHRAAGKRAVLTDLKTPLTRERLEE